jgi:4-hydroxybenzoate polyprenyltransferase
VVGLMNPIDKVPDITDEQKKKLKKLARKAGFKGALISTKFITLLFLANSVIVVLDQLYVHNLVFTFIGAFVNTLFLMRTLRVDLNNQRAKLAEEVKQILENK